MAYDQQLADTERELRETKAELARVKCALAEVADCHICAGPVGDHPYAECLECSRKALEDAKRRDEEVERLKAAAADSGVLREQIERVRKDCQARGSEIERPVVARLA